MPSVQNLTLFVHRSLTEEYEFSSGESLVRAQLRWFSCFLEAH